MVDLALSPQFLADELDRLSIRVGALPDHFGSLFEIRKFLDTYLQPASAEINTAPYLLELYDLIIENSSFEGRLDVDPDRLILVAQCLDVWIPRFPKAIRGRIETVRDHLHIEIIIGQAILGDFSHFAELAGQDFRKIEEHGSSDHFERLEKLVRIHRPDWLAYLVSRLSSARQTHKGLFHSGQFPGILSWSSREARNGSSSRGVISTLKCSVSAISAGGDRLELENRRISDAELHEVVTAGRVVLGDIHTWALKRTYQATATFGSNSVRVEGKSYKALLALLYAFEVVRFNNSRTGYSLADRIAITGDIASSGQLLPIEDDSIAGKVEAAFFSGMKVLVVPDEQVEKARLTLSELRSRYPDGSLDIVSKASLADIVADRRIVEIKTDGRAIHAAKTTWKNRAQIFPGAFLAIMLAVVFLFVSNRTDRRIVSYTIEDTATILFNNKDGDIVHAAPVSDKTLFLMKSKGARMVSIGDVNGDDYKDAFWVEEALFEKGIPSRIIGMDGKTLDTLLVFEASFDLDYPNDISIIHGNMHSRDIELADADSNGHLELYASFEHAEFYPSVLASIDPLTGSVKQTYHHPGALRDFMVFDLNDDDRLELLVGGTNNSSKEAVFFVLDPLDFTDSGPAFQPDYNPGPERVGKELAYYVLPSSPIAELAPVPVPMGHYLLIQADGSLSVASTDVYASYDNTTATAATVFFIFNKSFQPISIGTSTHWDMAYADAADEGLVPRYFGNDAKIELLNKIRRVK